MARGMVPLIRVAGDNEGKGGTGHCIGNKGGMQQRGQWQWQQEQWGRGCWASNGNVGNGNSKGKNVGDGDGNEAGRRQRGQG